MRGEDLQRYLSSYGPLEERAPANHPPRSCTGHGGRSAKCVSDRFDEIYGETGAGQFLHSPERLLRALLGLQICSLRALLRSLTYPVQTSTRNWLER